MSASSRSPDRFATTFDHEGLVANAGLILAGTLMDRLGLSALIERWVRTGSANPGPKICTVVAAMLAGATHIDHVGMLRAGRTGRVLGFRPMAPSTVGSFLRTFTFGHVRQLEAVLSRTLGARLGAGRGPRQGAAGGRSGLHDLRGPRQTKTRRRVRLHQRARLSPAARRTRRHRRGARRPHAQRVRGVLARRGALRRRARREPATRRGCRADHGARRLGILVMEADRPPRRPRLQVVDHRHPHTRCSRSDPSDPRHRVGRHRLTPKTATPKSPRRPMHHRPRQSRSAPFASSCAAPASPTPHSNDCGPTGDTTHSSPTPITTPPPPTSSTAPTPSSSSPSATSKKAPDSNTSPQATTAANCAWLACAVLAHNIGHWTNTPSPTRRRPRTAPAAPDSSPSPP